MTQSLPTGRSRAGRHLLLVRAGMAASIGCALLVSACSSSGTSGTSANASSAANSGGLTGSAAAGMAAAKASVTKAFAAPTGISQTVPLARKIPLGKKIVYLIDPNPANTLGGKSLEAAVKSASWQFSSVTYSVADPATFQAAAKTALDEGANYIAENGTPPSLLGNSVIQQIKSAGAKLIVASDYPSDNTDTINTDATNGDRYATSARLLADWFIVNSGGKGKALFSNVTAYPVLAHAAAAFKDEVAAKCPGCSVKIQGFAPTALANNSIVPSLVSTLRQDPSYTYVFFDYSAFSNGIYSALAAAGLNSVSVGGLGVDANVKAALLSGKPGAWIGTSYAYEGWAMADVAFRLATGTTAGFDTIKVQPEQIFTTSNASLLNSTSVFNNNDYNAPANALEQFETKIWKTK